MPIKILYRSATDHTKKQACWKCGAPCWNDKRYCWDCYKYEMAESR